MPDREDAWNELHDARPEHWFTGRPVEHKRDEWTMYAFDTRQ